MPNIPKLPIRLLNPTPILHQLPQPNLPQHLHIQPLLELHPNLYIQQTDPYHIENIRPIYKIKQILHRVNLEIIPFLLDP